MNWRFGAALAALIVLADQLLKAFTASFELGYREALIPGILWFAHVTNTGVAFGQFQGSNSLWLWVAVAVLGLLIYWHDHFEGPAETLAYWLVIGGLFGNLIDRVVRGHVVDMLDLGWWPVFNIADAAISVAVVILIVVELRRTVFKEEFPGEP